MRILLSLSLTLSLTLTLTLSAMSDEPMTRPSTAPTLPQLEPEQYETEERAAAAADEIEKLFPTEPPEAARMLTAILRGGQMGGDSGWFGPAQTRYTWKWLCEQQGVDPEEKAIAKESFRGPELVYERLDRNRDGRITPDDLDWSDKSPWVQQAGIINRVFRRLNSNGDGRLEKEELAAFFDRASQGRDHLTIDEFRQALMPPGAYLPGDAPNREMLVRGLFASELGSLHEGPRVGDAAPDFTLSSPDGKTTITLSEQIGSRPLVLVLGNFTCGPFRAYYPEVESVSKRFGDAALFLMVYVREAHPDDGWKMESNTRANVSLKQPTTLPERRAVCNQFRERLKPTMPVVVDDISDPVGNAYSGMPARLYVIDASGKIAYKSGRGPFGFKVGEMEQGLAMGLLEGE